MSECVVRMEMPSRCDLCDFWHVCKNVADFGKARYFEKPRELTVGMKGCKIVCQLPEGHGRLVDADKLSDDMKARKAFFGRMSDPQCLVDDAHTIVPAERSEL